MLITLPIAALLMSTAVPPTKTEPVKDVVHGIEIIDDYRWLEKLEKDSPECAQVARLRFLSGLSIDQTAVLLEIAPRTVSKRWNFARAWLRRAISGNA